MSEWPFSQEALALHDAAYEIETAADDSQPVTRAMCIAYGRALDAALHSMPAELFPVEAERLRGWVASGVIPADGMAWAAAVAGYLDKGPQR